MLSVLGVMSEPFGLALRRSAFADKRPKPEKDRRCSSTESTESGYQHHATVEKAPHYQSFLGADPPYGQRAKPAQDKPIAFKRNTN